jgi:HAMP domain-containing protein
MVGTHEHHVSLEFCLGPHRITKISNSGMKLGYKLIFNFITIGILASQIIFWQSYLSTRETIEKDNFNKLTAIRESKKRQIESYFATIQNQANTLAENHMVLDAAQEFHESFLKLGIADDNSDLRRNTLKSFYSDQFFLDSGLKKDDTSALCPADSNRITLQYQYIAANPFPLGFKDKLDHAEDDNAYDKAHLKYHSVFRDYIKRFGFYDLFLVDTEGNIVYTVMKEIDYATNLINGPLKGSNIGQAFEWANSKSKIGQTKIVDFEPYLPSYNFPAAFIATPLFMNQQRIGVLILQLPIKEINSVMTGGGEWQQDGLGKSGETYLVGADYTMRNDSRFLIENPDALKTDLERYGVEDSEIDKIYKYGTTILLKKVKTNASLDALNGNTDTRIIRDYRNIPVLSSYTPLKIQDLNWVLLSEIDVQEAFEPLERLKVRSIITVLFISLLIVLYGILFSRKINAALRQLQGGINRIEKGDLTHELKIETSDEFCDLADSFNKMAQNLRNTMASKDELFREIEQRKLAELEKGKLIDKLQDTLAEIRTLRGILPLCSFCNKVRDDKGYWEQVDVYIQKYSEANISHSVCPECAEKHYSEEYKKIKENKKNRADE